MATIPEDPAAVLEQFIHDVSNLPAEIAHLFEEAQAKQEAINECSLIINQRDTQLQRFIKQTGSLTVNPKEEQYSQTILENYDRAQALQNEKGALVLKASMLLDRHVKRLDIKIKDLQREGSMPVDPQMPTLLRDSPGNLVPPTSSTNTGISTPLQPLPINSIGGSSSRANAAIAQIQRGTNSSRTNTPGTNNLPSHSTSISSLIANAPGIAALSMGRQRESSDGLGNKAPRRNPPYGLNALPAQSSSLVPRMNSQGPGTPKPGTPGAGRDSRAGSAGARSRKRPAPSGRLDPRLQLLQRSKKSSKSGSKKSRTRHLAGSARASPSTTGEDSGASEDGSEDGNGSFPEGEEGPMDIDDEGTDDLTKYCYCQKVSYGNMVACDNSDCNGQWFHWDCAGITSEPEGEWLCRDCLRLPRGKIRKS